MLHWWRNHKRAMENVCCKEIVNHNIHSHINHKERLQEIREILISLRGDNSPEFNQRQYLELEWLVEIPIRPSSVQENAE